MRAAVLAPEIKLPRKLRSTTRLSLVSRNSGGNGKEPIARGARAVVIGAHARLGQLLGARDRELARAPARCVRPRHARSRLAASASSSRRSSTGSLKSVHQSSARCHARLRGAEVLRKVHLGTLVVGTHRAALQQDDHERQRDDEDGEHRPAARLIVSHRIPPCAACAASGLWAGLFSMQLAMVRRLGLQLRARARLAELALDDQLEEQRHEEDREERRREHAAHDAGADRVARAGAGAGRDRERQHAEDERERGHQDRAEAQPRRLDRRRRRRQALVRASARANSTIRIAFFAARPSSVTRPIWKYTSLVRPRSHTAASAPNVPNGSASSTESGSDQLLVLRGEDQEHHDHAPAPSANVDVPLECFSWYDVPPQSKLKSGGSTSLAICSTARDRLARADARRAPGR